MLKNKTALSLSPLALLTLAACGGSSISVGSKAGKAQKGPLENARAFLDYNDNGVWDSATEPGDLTSSTGAYTISETLLPSAVQTAAGYSLVVTTDGLTVDTSTGAVLSGVTMSAPTTSSMITPVTTLVEEGGLTQAQVVAALGLPATFDPMTFDAFSTTLTAAEKTTALSVEKVAQKVMAAVTTFAAVAEGSGVSAALAFEGAMSSVVAQVAVASAASGTMTVSAADIDAISALMSDQYDAGGKFKAAVDAGSANKATYTTQATSTTDAIKNVAAAITAITSEDLAASKDLFSVVQVMQDQVKAAAVSTNTSGLATAVAIASATDANGDGIADVVATAAANKAPSAIALSSSSLIETKSANADGSVTVGTVTTTDADNASGHTYAIVESVGTDFADFTITSAGVLSLKAQPDYETKTSYSVAVSTTDTGGKTFADLLTVSITDDTTEGGAFQISNNMVTWTDYNPSSATAGTDIQTTVMTTTTDSTKTVDMGGTVYLNHTNLTYLFDAESAGTTGKSPMLKFSLSDVPTGVGSATITASILDHNGAAGTEGVQAVGESAITLTATVDFVGDGTTATLTVPVQSASGSFKKSDGTTESTFTVASLGSDVFTITQNVQVDGTSLPTLDVKMSALYDAFIAGAGSSDMVNIGSYGVKIETTLPLADAPADSTDTAATVTTFQGIVELVASTPTNSISGTSGADSITALSSGGTINGYGGADTITLGAGTDYVILDYSAGSATKAGAATVANFVDGTDKFVINGLTNGVSDLTVVAGDTAGDSLISIKASASASGAEEYLMHVTDVAYTLLSPLGIDYVTVAEIA